MWWDSRDSLGRQDRNRAGGQILSPPVQCASRAHGRRLGRHGCDTAAEDRASRSFQDVLTGQKISIEQREDGAAIPLAQAFAHCPAALLGDRGIVRMARPGGCSTAQRRFLTAAFNSGSGRPNVRTLAVNVWHGAVFPMARDGEDFHVLVPHALPGQTYSLVLDDSRGTAGSGVPIAAAGRPRAFRDYRSGSIPMDGSGLERAGSREVHHL